MADAATQDDKTIEVGPKTPIRSTLGTIVLAVIAVGSFLGTGYMMNGKIDAQAAVIAKSASDSAESKKTAEEAKEKAAQLAIATAVLQQLSTDSKDRDDAILKGQDELKSEMKDMRAEIRALIRSDKFR